MSHASPVAGLPDPDPDLVLVLRPVGGADQAADAEIVFASEAWRTAFCSGVAVTGRRLLDVQPAFGDGRLAAVAQAARSGKVQRLVLQNPLDADRSAVVQITPMDDTVLVVSREASAEDLLREQLRENDARFRAVLDASPDSIGLFRPVRDAAGRLVDVAPMFVNRTSRMRWFGGLEMADIAGRSMVREWPHAAGQVMELYRPVVEQGAIVSEERHFQLPGGGDLWVDLYVTMTPHGLLHTSRDVTEAHLRAEELRLVQARFEAVVATAREAISITRPVYDGQGNLADLLIEWVNPAWSEVFDAGVAQPVGMSAWALRPELSALRPVHEAVLRDGTSRRVEHRLADGRWLSIDFSRLDDGLMSVSRDVTDERNLEAATRLRLVAAIEHTSESVVVADLDGDILYVNPAFEAVTGYSREEVVGRNPRILKSGRQDVDVYRALWATITSGRTWHGELVNRRKDGILYIEEAAISPVPDERGTPIAYVAVKRDITAQRDLEARLRQAQRLEAVGRLAGGVAHDFNNVIAAIRGYGEMMLDAIPSGSPQRDDLEQVLIAADRGATLTRQLLAFSRRLPLDPRPVDPRATVDTLAPMLRRLVGEHISLTASLSGTQWVLVDPGELEQVVLNLVVNARDAMPDGGAIRIAVADADRVALDSGPMATPVPVVRLSVADDGCGMEPETLARIFEPYFTTKPEGKGTGLGLATVYGIVTASGGAVWATSTPRAGSVFTVDLPAHHPPAAREIAGGTPTAELARAGEVILVVEDEVAVRHVIARALGLAGYVVRQAGNGGEALAVLASMPRLDLLVSDVRMPGIQGPVLARRVLGERPGTRVLLVSGFAVEIEEHGSLPDGVRVLEKPFTSAELLAAVRAVLDAPAPA